MELYGLSFINGEAINAYKCHDDLHNYDIDAHLL